MINSRRLRQFVFTLLALCAPAAIFAQGATGTVTGTLREQGTGRPISNARVTVVGTSIAVPTRDDGTYTIREVPAGRQEIRVLALGHAAQKQAVTVVSGGSSSLNFTLASVAVQLEQVVTTATGQERKVEVGNDIPKINAARDVQERPITNITDLLTAKAPGVDILGGTFTGTGQRIRIRGQNSLSLSNDPIVIIDGIRMESATGSSSIDIGGSRPSRLSDIDPNQIETVEVVKGPSASTLYGTDAANGVIVITTKRGRVGRAKINTFIQHGRIVDRNKNYTAYTLFGHAPSGAFRSTASGNCTLALVSAGSCIPDSLAAYNLYSDPEVTPNAASYQEEYGADVSGGSETLRYFLQASYNGEQGVYKLPAFERKRLLALNGFIPGAQLRPNALTRATFRGNVNLQLSPLADIAVSTAYISSALRLPQTENNSVGVTSNSYGGPGYRTNGPVTVTATCGVNATDCGAVAAIPPRNGYRFFTPGEIFQNTVTQDVNRFIGSITPNWRPKSWLTTRGNFGVDFTNRVDEQLCRLGQCPDFSTYRQGFKQNNRTNFFQYTADASGTAQFQLTPAINSKSTVGTQYFRRVFSRNGAGSAILTPGATTVTAGSILVAGVDAIESTDYKVTLGSFFEQTFALHDRLFLTGAARIDDNSSFGTNSSRAVYPKASLSWILSEEPFFPKPRFLNQFRIRSAFGASGTSPGANDALPFFAAGNTNIVDQSTPALFFSAVGNPNLRPEKASELEGGVDVDMFDNRVSIAATVYKKLTKDALVQRILPPSAGVSSARFENIGRVQNTGFETSVRAQVIQTRWVGFDANLNYAVNDNKLVTLGEGIPPIVGSNTRNTAGYPLFGYWMRPILAFSDINKDGILTQNELVVGDSAVFYGRSIPHVELTFSPGLDLFNQKIRVTAQIDHKGGFITKESTERIRCANRNNCRGLTDITAPLAEQARSVAVRDHPSRTQSGFLEKGDFTKLREVAVTLYAPKSWTQSRILRGDRLSLTLAGRNLKTWTQFTGIDPEAAAGAEGDLQDPFQAVAPPTYYTLRLNFGF